MSVEAEKAQGIPQRPGVFYGWWIVAVTLLVEVTTGASAYAFPIFYKPMAAAMGWSRTTVAIAPTLRSVVTATISPVVGRLVDRYGPRVILFVGVVLMGGTSVAMASIGQIWQYLLVYSVMGATALVFEGNLVTFATVAKWFVRKRGRAMAFMSMGVSISGVVFTPIGTYLVVNHGWRTGWVVIGVTTWVLLLLPVALVMRRQPEDMGLLPDGEAPQPSQAPPPGAAQAAAPGQGPHQRRATAAELEESWTLGQAVRSKTFWLIIAAFNLGSMSISSVLLHQFNFITDKGFSEATAAAVVTIYAFNAIIAKLVYGFVSERVHVRWLVVVCFVGGGVGLAILNGSTTFWMLLLYAFVYGLTRGAYVLVIPLTYANYFGRAFAGTIRGFTAPFNVIASAAGPLFAAWVYDATESYQMAFTLFSLTFFMGAFLMLLAKPTRPPAMSSPRPRPE